MMETLLRFLFPNAPASTEGAAATLGHEGIAWSTAAWWFALLAVVVVFSYTRFARQSSRFSRIGLSVLRLILIAILLLLLVRPILIIPRTETSRMPLLVLLDTSRSMTITDHRESSDDRARAAIAAGTIDPKAGLGQTLPAAPLQPSRADLLASLAANPGLALWPRLHANADLQFHGFGTQTSLLGPLEPASGNDPLTTAESERFFRAVTHDGEGSALGDGLRNVLSKVRSPVAGVLVISDGANNAGSSPLDAAREALADDVPLFVYGIGVNAPPDIILTELVAPAAVAVKERVNVVVRFRSQGLVGTSSTLRLTAGDKELTEERVDFRSDGAQEWRFSYIPETTGKSELTASIVPLPQESVRTNNTLSAGLRIHDERINVLLVQREPNWDFQYLLAFLNRDRRVHVKCSLLHGDPDLSSPKNSPYLPALPSDRAGLLGNDVIILGDVAPADLGPARLSLLHEWVDQVGGGLVLLSGSNLNANSYRGTPLEPLMPVTPGGNVPKGPDTARFPLTLTAAGMGSPLLRLAGNSNANSSIWTAFPGVRWMTPSGPARPSAQVLLTGPGNPAPVALALQPYGAGQCLYVGFGETHLWRSRHGEKYYAQIWLQILEALSARRDAGASPFNHLKIERTEYFPGERVRLTARALNSDFTPSKAPELTVNVRTGAKDATPTPLRLTPVAGRPGEFSGEMAAPAEGSYTASLAHDAAAEVPFKVKSSAIELADISLHERSLRAMAAAGGGRFLREEDLHQLPDWIASKNMPLATYQKFPLTLSPTLLALMILAACAEWLWRRKIDLK